MKKILLTIMLIVLLPTISFSEASNGSPSTEILNLIDKYSELRGLPPEVVYQVIDVESDFNTNANSKHGKYSDQGLMQLNSQWSRGRLRSNPISKFNAFNPEHNINMGTYLLSAIKKGEEKKGYHGKQLWERTLTIYNAGHSYLKKYGIRYKYVSKFNLDKVVQGEITNDRKTNTKTSKKNWENTKTKIKY